MMKTKEKLSLVVPCFNEEDTVVEFYNAVQKIETELDCLDFEYIFIDDGSSDATLLEIKRLHELDQRVNYLSFSRNFGKEGAVFAGLTWATGDYIAVMDVDLQDPPTLLPLMYKEVAERGYDCVATRRSTRKGEPPIRSFFAHTFYKLMRKISKTEIVDGARDYRFMTRQMVDAILSLKEYNRFLKGLYSWVGFKTKWIEYENIERSSGQTKWSFWKLFVYSVEGIIAFSTAPLVMVSLIGTLFCLFSFMALCFILTKSLIWGDPVSGWPSLVCVITFLGGIQLLCMGIIGLYLSKAYMETKNRPIYIVRETNITVKMD